MGGPEETVEAVTRMQIIDVPRREVRTSLETKVISMVDWKEERKDSMRARYIYGIAFLIPNLCAWIARDYGQYILPQFHYLKSCGTDGKDCFHSLGVLRVSLGCFMYFAMMLITTFRTKKLYQLRNNWHSGWWTLKIFLLILSLVVTVLFPPELVELYGEFARVGAGIFLVLQLISVIQFINWWNKYWMPNEVKKQSCSLGLFMSTVFYVGSIIGIVYIYTQYGTKISCGINIFFITWTAFLLIVMMVISLHSKVNKGLLSSGIMASYVIYLCWSALRSEPENDKCNTGKRQKGSDWTDILGFFIAIGAIVMATFSTGIDSQSFQFRQDNNESADGIPYSYGFFHLVFSLGAMYFAMLFISWNLNNSARKWSMDIGWASTWVKIVNEWFAAIIYLWTLISPVLRQSKVTNCEEAVEERNNTALPRVLSV